VIRSQAASADNESSVTPGDEGDMAAAANSVADATQELYRRYGKQIYAYCLHQLRSREEAEDAVQTTFLNAFRGLQRGTTMRFEQAWLYKIAQNVCIARRSSSGKRLKLEALDDFEVLQEIVPSGGSGGDGDTLELMGLDEALDSMPENQRRAILLREWQGLSYREISAELGLSQGAVEMLIFRARRTLASALEQPAESERRRRSTARAGSFGSIVAALKSLLSGGAAVKMAAVAASAAVVGTNAVHTVVQQTFDLRPHGALVRTGVVHTSPRVTARVVAPARPAVVNVHPTTAHTTSRAAAPVAQHLAILVEDAQPVVATPPVVPAEAPPAPAVAPAQPEPAPAPQPAQSAPATPSPPPPAPAASSGAGLTHGANEQAAPAPSDTEGQHDGRDHGHHGNGYAPLSTDPAPSDTQPPTTTTPTDTTSTVTTADPSTQPPAPSPTADPVQPSVGGAAPGSWAGHEHGNDGGGGDGHGHSHGHGHGH